MAGYPWVDPSNKTVTVATLNEAIRSAYRGRMGDLSGVRTPEAHGAVGNGSTNDQTALAAMFAACVPGDVVYLDPTKTYAHNAVLSVSVAGVTVTGGGRLKATTATASSLKIQANNVTLDNIIHEVATPTVRGGNWEDMNVAVLDCTGFVARNVRMIRSNSVGLYFSNVQRYYVENCYVYETLADAFHNTNESAYGILRNCKATNPGDDGMAVVSYNADGGVCHDIEIFDFQMLAQTHGRGISVIGGTRIKYYNPVIHRSKAAAIYIAAEGAPWNTYGVDDCHVYGGRVVGSNTDATVEHGAIYILSDHTGYNVGNCSISDVEVYDTIQPNPSIVRQITLNSGTFSAITVDRITIERGANASNFDSNAPTNTIRRRGWRRNGAALADVSGF